MTFILNLYSFGNFDLIDLKHLLDINLYIKLNVLKFYKKLNFLTKIILNFG